MKLAILTSVKMPNMLTYDMEAIALLEKRGIEPTILIWDKVSRKIPNEFQKYDAILIRTIWDYFLKYDEYLKLLDILAASKIPVFNSVDVLKWNSNKKYLKELQMDGFDIIPTIFSESNNKSSYSKVMLNGWTKFVLKPLISGNSYHTFVVDRGDEARFFSLIEKYYVHRPYMLQEFIPEISAGEISTISFSNGFSYSVTKVPPKGEYRVQFDYGGIYHYGEVDPKIGIICDRIANRFNEKLLYQRVDGLWRDGKFLLMEVELIEPDLYLNLNKDALINWVDALTKMIE